MKKILITILVFCFSFFNINYVLAANTHSIDLELSSSQYLSVADSVSLSLTGDLTIEAWIKLESTPPNPGYYTIVGKQSDTPQRGYYIVYMQESTVKSIRLYISTDGAATGSQFYDKAQTLSTGTWYHIAVSYSYSDGIATFYVDGSSIGTVDLAGGNIFDNTADFTIGALDIAPPGLFFDGLIDEVRVWDDIRTPTEISDNYDTELTGSEGNLQGYWKLNNGLLDETTNDNDLTNNNSAVFSTDVPFAGEAADTCTPTLDGVWKMDLQDYCTTTASTYSDYGMECYNPVGGSWVIANGIEVRRGSTTNCIPQCEGTAIFSIQPIH